MAFKDTAKAFLDRVLATVPEEKKEEVRSLYSKAHEDLATESTTLEEMTARVTETAQKQNEWWKVQEPKVREYDKLKLAAARPEDKPAGMTAEEIQKQITASKEETLSTGLGLVTTLNDLSMKHYKEFDGEVLDTRALASEAMKQGTSLENLYNQQVADRRQKRHDEKYVADMAAAEKKGRDAATQELLSKSGNSMPYPVGVTAPTTLAGLKKPAEGQPNPFSLDAAVATANAVAQKQAGT